MSLSILRLKVDEPAFEIVAQWRHDAFFADGGAPFEETRDSRHRWLELPSDYETALLAEVAGNPAGYCLFVHEEIDAKHDLTPWLASLYVVSEFRGQGFGGALVALMVRTL